MNIRCPTCDQSVETVKQDLLEQIDCPACGSHISLIAQGLEPDDSLAAQTLGQFTLIEELGRGAFGSVWKARDNALERFVAVKLPRKEQLSNAETDQFVREARAAAQLRHPHIVGVHEVGRQDGQLFIVCDLVDGLTLAERMAMRSFSIRESAQLVTTLSTAIQFAHDQGVIHRDLKPANILIDEDGQPHITDFGLAKREATDITMTLEGQILGTPAYMSPEQARGESHQVDPRSDIYSLGVILFELATGELPFRGSQRMLVMQILTHEPPRLQQLDSRVPRDLETICLRCLEKDPQRRYEDAAALADDLGRFLRHENIKARPVGKLERSWRWCRRNPLAAALSGLLATVLIVGIVAVSGQWWRAESNLAESERQRIKARRNFNMALDAVDTYLSQISENSRLKSHGFEVLRRDLLRTAREFYDVFIEENANELELQLARGRAYLRLAVISDQLGEFDESRRTVQEAIRNYEATRANNPAPQEALLGLAQSYVHLGDLHRNSGEHELAIEVFGEALTCFDRLSQGDDTTDHLDELAALHYLIGLTQEFRGKTAEADEAYRTAIDLQSSIVEQQAEDPDHHFDLAKSRDNYAYFLTLQGQHEAPERLHQSAIEALEKLVVADPDVPKYARQLSLTRAHLGQFFKNQGDFDQAAAQYQQALNLDEMLVRKHPDVIEYQKLLAGTYSNIGVLSIDRGNSADGLTMLTRCRDILIKLVERLPERSELRSGLAMTLNNLAALRGANQEWELAERNLRRSCAHYQQLVARHPQTPQYIFGLSNAALSLGGLLGEQTRWEESRGWLESAIEHLSDLQANLPERSDLQELLFDSHCQLAMALDELPNLGTDAVKAWQQACELAPRESLRETRSDLARSLMLHDRRRDGIALADELRRDPAADQRTSYGLARAFAVAANQVRSDETLSEAVREEQSNHLAQLAIAQLWAAQRGGFFDDAKSVAQFREETDFEMLRQRAGVQQLFERCVTQGASVPD